MLLARERTNVLDGVARLVGLQAQAPRPPFVGLWTRLEGFGKGDLPRLLSARLVVRVTAMRGTLHLMTAADYLAQRGALQPALTRGMQSVLRDRATALDFPALDAFARAFFAKAGTFDGLRTALQKKYPNGDERAMAYAIRTSLPLVQVPTDARWGFLASADFSLAEAWLGKTVPTSDAPAHVLVRRYLAGFGPATPADAQVWSGLPALREIFESLRRRSSPFATRANASCSTSLTRPVRLQIHPRPCASSPNSTTSCCRTPIAPASWPTSTAPA